MSKCFNPTCGYYNLPQIFLLILLKCYQSGLNPMKVQILLFTLHAYQRLTLSNFTC